MSGKIVLYERENYKQARKNLLLDNFSDVLYREKFLVFVEICSEQIFLSLIIYKSLRRAALTIANAVFTLCAGGEVALTSFEYFPPCIE